MSTDTAEYDLVVRGRRGGSAITAAASSGTSLTSTGTSSSPARRAARATLFCTPAHQMGVLAA